MICPGCGETNDEGYRFCRNCGRALPSAAVAVSGAAPSAGQPATPKAPSVYRLVGAAGLLSGRTFTIVPAGLTIGRDPANCQVVVADDEISRLHAWIGFNEQGEVVVRDRHSANGTYVNKVRVQEKILRPWDEVAFGSARRHLFRIERIVGPAAKPSKAASGALANRPARRRSSPRG